MKNLNPRGGGLIQNIPNRAPFVHNHFLIKLTKSLTKVTPFTFYEKVDVRPYVFFTLLSFYDSNLQNKTIAPGGAYVL